MKFSPGVTWKIKLSCAKVSPCYEHWITGTVDSSGEVRQLTVLSWIYSSGFCVSARFSVTGAGMVLHFQGMSSSPSETQQIQCSSITQTQYINRMADTIWSRILMHNEVEGTCPLVSCLDNQILSSKGCMSAHHWHVFLDKFIKICRVALSNLICHFCQAFWGISFFIVKKWNLHWMLKASLGQRSFL